MSFSGRTELLNKGLPLCRETYTTLTTTLTGAIRWNPAADELVKCQGGQRPTQDERLIRVENLPPKAGIMTVANLVSSLRLRALQAAKNPVIDDSSIGMVGMDGQRIDKVTINADSGAPE